MVNIHNTKAKKKILVLWYKTTLERNFIMITKMSFDIKTIKCKFYYISGKN